MIDGKTAWRILGEEAFQDLGCVVLTDGIVYCRGSQVDRVIKMPAQSDGITTVYGQPDF